MTFSLDDFVRYFVTAVVRSPGARRYPRLDPKALSRRDLADLNLPADVLSKLRQQSDLEDARRKLYR